MTVQSSAPVVVSLAAYARQAAESAPQYSDRAKHAEGHLAALAQPVRPELPPRRRSNVIGLAAGIPLRDARLREEGLTALAAAIEAAELPPQRAPLVDESHIWRAPS